MTESRTVSNHCLFHAVQTEILQEQKTIVNRTLIVQDMLHFTAISSCRECSGCRYPYRRYTEKFFCCSISSHSCPSKAVATIQMMYIYMYTTTIPLYFSFQSPCLRPQRYYSPFQFPLLSVQGRYSSLCFPLLSVQGRYSSLCFPLLSVQGRYSSFCLPLPFTQCGQHILYLSLLSFQDSYSSLSPLLVQTHPCQTSLYIL